MGHRLAAVLTFAIWASLLNACGGGGGGDGGGGGSNPATSAQQLAGVVVDGYIEGATVCLDLNLNNACDSGERTAVTGPGGAYSLNIDGLDAAAVASAMLIVDIPETAKDADDNGKTLAEAGKVATRMVAPVVTTAPGQHVISPLTTFVAERMRSAGLTSPLATEWVRSRLGLNPTDQINADFRSPDADPATRDRLSTIASNLFDVQGRAWQRCLKDQRALNVTSPERNCAVVVISNLMDAINPDDIEGLSSSQADQVRDALMLNFLRIMASRTLYSGAPTINTMLATDFRPGLSEFRDMGITMRCAADATCTDQGGDYRIRSLRYVDTSVVNDGTLDTEDYYAVMEPTFVPNNAAPRDYWELREAQWQPVAARLQISLQGDGDFRIKGGQFGSTGVAMSARGFQLDVLPLNLAGLNRFAADAFFPIGARGYLLSYFTGKERYVLSGPRLRDQAQSELTGDLPGAFPSAPAPTWTNAFASHTGMSMTFGPVANGAGTVSFRNPDVPDEVMPQTGSYRIVTVDGQEILKIHEIPSEVLSALELLDPVATADYARGVRPIFGVAPDGYLREGTYTPVSNAPNPHLHLNRTALNAILEARSLCQVDENYANINCPN